MSDQINNTNQPGGISSLLVIGSGLVLRAFALMEDDGVVNFVTVLVLIIGGIKGIIELYRLIKPKQK